MISFILDLLFIFITQFNMKPEDFINDAFLKQFKDGKEFMSFMDQMYKRGVEKMLEGELDAHLGYEKHDKAEKEHYQLQKWLSEMKSLNRQLFYLKDIYLLIHQNLIT